MSAAAVVTAMPAATWTRCRLCRAKLEGDAKADVALGVCGDCTHRPEAARLAVGANGHVARTKPPAGPRAFTPADKALIKSLHGYLPAAELLRILNERLTADLGAHAVPYTLEHLHAEVQGLIEPTAGADDWTSIRRVLVQARRQGVLDAITPAVIDDFAIVFGLSAAQVLHLKDVLGSAKGGV